MSSSTLLLSREFHSLKKRPRSNYFQVYDLVNNNIHEWIIFVLGPPSTLYEGGVYRAIMRFPETYPIDPPSIQFVCSMFHPNIFLDGKVCISTLQNPPPGESYDGHWRPVLGVEQAILSVISLLSDPNTDDPASPEASALFTDSPDEFRKRVRHLAEMSKLQVPDDFVYPVVVGVKPDTSKGKPAPCKKALHTVTGSDSEEDEYVYSDDEWGFEGHDSEEEDSVQDVSGGSGDKRTKSLKRQKSM